MGHVVRSRKQVVAQSSNPLTIAARHIGSNHIRNILCNRARQIYRRTPIVGIFDQNLVAYRAIHYSDISVR